MESAAIARPAATPLDTSAPGAKGLKAGALGYMSNLVIAVASTAPAYSLATTLGFVAAVSGIGTHAPAVLLVSFVPILFISAAYRYLNLADPDAGTTFAWTTRAMGPQMGWINGWAIFLADVIVMASLSEIASVYTFELVGWHAASTSTAAIIIGSVVWIALMTWICYRGIELSARIQMALLSLECLTLGIFAGPAVMSTYWKTEAPPARLDWPVVEVTTISAGPAPSWVGFGDPGAVVRSASGKVTSRVVLFTTWKLDAAALPTWTLATRGVPAVPNPWPDTATTSPPATEPELGDRPVTAGGESWPL